MFLLWQCQHNTILVVYAIPCILSCDFTIWTNHFVYTCTYISIIYMTNNPTNTSSTLVQHCTNVIQMFCAYWEVCNKIYICLSVCLSVMYTMHHSPLSSPCQPCRSTCRHHLFLPISYPPIPPDYNYKYIEINRGNPFSAGIDFRSQNLMPVDVRFWRVNSVPAP